MMDPLATFGPPPAADDPVWDGDGTERFAEVETMDPPRPTTLDALFQSALADPGGAAGCALADWLGENLPVWADPATNHESELPDGSRLVVAADAPGVSDLLYVYCCKAQPGDYLKPSGDLIYLARGDFAVRFRDWFANVVSG